MHTEDEVLDVRGAAKLLRMGRNAIYDACGRGEIPHRRIGNRLRFSRTALLRWLGGSAPADTTSDADPIAALARRDATEMKRARKENEASSG
jgi:excisionase family DNA binding protein